MLKNIVEPDRPQMAIQYGACAFCAGYPRLQTKSSEYVILIAFHCNNGYANMPLYYIIRTLPGLCWIVVLAVTTCLPVCVHDCYQCFIVPLRHRKTVFCLSHTAATGLVLWSLVCVLCRAMGIWIVMVCIICSVSVKKCCCQKMCENKKC